MKTKHRRKRTKEKGKLNEFEAKRQNTPELGKKGVNHERHEKHGKRGIKE
jgi:hypothetical protein